MWGFSRRRQARPTFSSEAQVYDVICEDKIVGRIMLPRHLRPMGLDANLRKTLGKPREQMQPHKSILVRSCQPPNLEVTEIETWAATKH
jgi:hypothetical protein